MLLYKTHFPAFVVMLFRLAFPNAVFQPAWHIDLLCDRVMAIINRQERRLLVNMPPRYLKTFVCSVCLPIFWLTKRPDAKILLVVRSHDLGRELSGRIMDIMTSSRFRALFPHVKVRSDNAYTITTAHGGTISIVLAGAPIAGKGVDLAIVDDPVSPSDGGDEKLTTRMNDWFDGELMPRFNDKSRGAIVVATVRTAFYGDLSHHLWDGLAVPWTDVLSLTAIAANDEEWRLSDGRVFRRPHSYPLCPSRESFEQLQTRLYEMGPDQFLLQYMQAHPGTARGVDLSRGGGHEMSCFYPEGWTVNDGFPGAFVGITAEAAEDGRYWDIRFGIFGIGPPPVGTCSFAIAEHQRVSTSDDRVRAEREAARMAIPEDRRPAPESHPPEWIEVKMQEGADSAIVPHSQSRFFIEECDERGFMT